MSQGYVPDEIRITNENDYDLQAAQFHCFMCNCGLDHIVNSDDTISLDPTSGEYVTLPDGMMVTVCLGRHVCHHDNGKAIPSYSDKQYISDMIDTIKRYGSSSPYMQALCNHLACECHDWKYPCYTCYTEY